MAFGRLSHRTHAAPLHDINVTPLVDVLLVLLVVFMLCAPLLTSALRLDLPRSAAPAAPAAALSVSLTANLQLHLNEQAVDAPVLARQLRAAAEQNPQTEVQLRVDAAVPYGEVVALMDVVQAAGLSHIGFVTQARR